MTAQKRKPRATAGAAATRHLTLWNHFTSLAPRLVYDDSVPNWPPDAFALCMSLLMKSGAYSRVLRDWPPGHSSSVEDWANRTRTTGRSWPVFWFKGKVPARVLKLWDALLQYKNQSVRELRSNVKCCQILLELSALADEASVGVGVPGEPAFTEDEQLHIEKIIAHVSFHARADKLLEMKSGGSTLGYEVPRDRARVLPKMRTPQSGLTARSLSHNISVIIANEMTPHWSVVGNYVQQSASMRLLVVPWPYRIFPAQFLSTKPLRSEMQNMPDEFGFFTFRHRSNSAQLLRIVKELYKAAKASVDRIDGIIFPEAAITPKQHEALRRWVLAQDSFLIAGVSEHSLGQTGHGKNYIRVDVPRLRSLEQHKHHRWKLDDSQIRQYGLGAFLSPEKNWWEHVNVEDRQLLFLAMQNWLLMSVLICEDLARPDPVGDLVRAVGPNLVISLLMDGPQLKERWGGRYATTLADDPGSSVLTVTSLGMSTLSRPSQGETRPRVIALWKDTTTSSPVELELPVGHHALVLSLTVRFKTEWTADGRGDEQNAGYPLLSGVCPIRLPKTLHQIIGDMV